MRRIRMIKPIGKYINPSTFEGAHEVPSEAEGVVFASQIVVKVPRRTGTTYLPTVR
jgi:hypothetical protein